MCSKFTKIYLFISTDNIGGAELRYFGLWKYMMSKNFDRFQIFLVISSALYKTFSERDKDSNQYLTMYKHRIILVDFTGKFEVYKNKIKKFINENVLKDDILHFIDGHPLLKTDAHQVFSITQSSLDNLNLKGRLVQFMGMYSSDAVDVLDPKIFNTFKKIFFNKKNKFNLTTNSFCDTDKFEIIPFNEKKDWFVFLGRFEKVKQIDRLIQLLPSIHKEFKNQFTDDLRFIFIGYGSLEDKIREIIKNSDYKDIPISIEYSNSPQEILRLSRYFFSLQLNNNYPSRSLIEAMCAGNIPICTDVGQTRWLAKADFSFYVPELFNESHIHNVLNEIKDNSLNELSRKSIIARETVFREHTIEKMGDYYLNIYNKII